MAQLASPPQNSRTNPTAQNIANQQMPSGPIRCVPLGFNFSTAATFDLNLVNFMNQGKIDIIQGAWIDNSQNPNPVTLSNIQTGQNVTCKGYAQGYFPIFAVQPVTMLISSTIGAVDVNVTLYNVPIAPSNWDTQTLANQGTIPVSDAILDGTVSGGKVNTNNKTVYTPLAGSQYGLAIAAATALTVPVGDIFAIISVEVAGCRWRDDGTNPTATVGMPLAIGAYFMYNGNLSAIKFIAQTAGALLNVSYYS